jgi:hypothetical protein
LVGYLNLDVRVGQLLDLIPEVREEPSEGSLVEVVRGELIPESARL